MSRATSAVAALLALALSAGIANAVTVNISATENAFTPQNVLVHPGDIVHWTNNGNAPHDISSGAPGAPDQVFSAVINPGQSFDWVVGTPPVAAVTLNYQCDFHAALGMKGKLRVVR